ncbi:permease [Dactylosporangium siamense]|uniref:Permease n=2 Tax=Dactylosporangium siamense TaxID=685454 RepID=A0A919PGX4_9ACTN|nr:permease [Dactylosporangium siamense]
MMAGHFALAAAVKAGQPRTPLWALMLATQLLDVIFVILFLAGGVEGLTDVTGGSYGEALIHAYWTHSLIGALGIAAAAAGVAGWRWGRRPGLVIGATVFSHWLLDLLVHRADLPILPGNAGDLPLLGLGLWRTPWASAAVELALVLTGAVLYLRSARRHGVDRRWAFTTAALLLLILAVDVAS